MPEISVDLIRKALIAFGLTVALAVPACALAQEGKLPDLLGLKGNAGATKGGAEWSASLQP
ncbi:MAG TPA: hypothetical protein VGH74_23020, partial [Planctomycetaceae bacterium]